MHERRQLNRSLSITFFIGIAVYIHLLSTLRLRVTNREDANSNSNRFTAIMSTNTLSPRDERLESKCAEAVGKLVDSNINFLAIDFDQTMIDVHTGGRWKESVTELAQHLRPLFLHLVPIATQHNIRIAIVTFSPQTKHIREVLEHAFPTISDIIPIRGNDRTWSYEGNGMKLGKQQHMASAVEELLQKTALGVTDVTKNSTLLIDDDARNIRKSHKDGVRGLWFNPMDPNQLLDDILSPKFR